MAVKKLKRNIIQRLFGIPATEKPKDPECWKYSDGVVIINLERTPELDETWGALRLESERMPRRVLVVRGEGTAYYAFNNCCKHGRRRLDPVPGENQVQCCSIGKSTFDLDGKRISGSAAEDIEIFALAREGNRLKIDLQK